MKKMALLFGLLLLITLLSGYSCSVMGQSETQSVPSGLKGEWRVVSTNCLDVIAEKGGLRHVFVFKPPTGYDPGMAGDMGIMAKCKEVKPGWIIIAESEEKYSFFPPVLPVTTKPRIAPPTGLRTIEKK
jgi:hypothetical protein